MKRGYTQLSAVFLAVVLSLSLCVPACTAVEYTSTGTFWGSVFENAPDFVRGVVGILSRGTCSVSDDTKHHGSLVSLDPNEKGFYVAKCDYCSRHFPVPESDVKAAYDEYTTTINNNYGSTVLVSGGGWYLVPKLTSLTLYDYGSKKPQPLELSFQQSFNSSFGATGYTWLQASFDCSSFPSAAGTLFMPIPENTEIGKVLFSGKANYNSPIKSLSGVTIYTSSLAEASVSLRAGQSILLGSGWNIPAGFRADALIASKPFEANAFCTLNADYSFLSQSFYFVPTSSTGTIINQTDTRVGSLAGNFGYYGDNGQLIAAENMTIVNETNSTYTNPQTGTTAPITNWTYDYSDRSYKLTLDNGDTITVTYGDENVTINEGDTIYNIYYVSPGGGGSTDPDPSPSPSPNASPSPSPGPGPSPGPDTPDGDGSIWDKLGALLGSFINGLLGMFESFASKILDGLTALVDGVMVRLKGVVDALLNIFDTIPSIFSGLLGFLGATFAFLPEEIIMLIEFGIFATILVGLLLLIFKR